MKKPPHLNFGDTIGIIAPASAPKDSKVIQPAIDALKNLGFKVKLGKHLRARKGFLAGEDLQRLHDLHAMFADKRVNGIICLRGGYGSGRLLSKIDYKLIAKNPKVFCGFSDLTALHLAINKMSGLVTFHAPTALSFIKNREADLFSLESFYEEIFEPLSGERIIEGSKLVRIAKGKATGELTGGNLSILTSLLGTKYFPVLKNKILFLEDVGEAPYRIDRMITQLLNAEVLKGVKGIACGVFSGCDEARVKGKIEYRQTVQDVLTERLGKLGVPVLMNLSFGHIDSNSTLPYGVRAMLDADKKVLMLNEKGVR